MKNGGEARQGIGRSAERVIGVFEEEHAGERDKEEEERGAEGPPETEGGGFQRNEGGGGGVSGGWKGPLLGVVGGVISVNGVVV